MEYQTGGAKKTTKQPMSTQVETKGRKIITPYIREPRDQESLEYNLFKMNQSMVPGTSKKFYPARDARGRVITGLDENAVKILAIADKEVREAEQERVRTLRNYYEFLSGEDLRPESDYWKMVCGDLDNLTNSGGAYLEDKNNIFDMDNPEHAITYYWLMETKMIAPSLEHLTQGKVDPAIVKFYVYDEIYETDEEFSRKKKLNSVKVALDGMTEGERKRIGKLLGLGITEESTSKKVYNTLDNYLSTPKTHLDVDPIATFTKYAEMSKETIYVKNIINDLISLNIVRLKGGVVKEGETIWAKTVDEFEATLLDHKNAEILESFEDKIKQKRIINSI